MEGILPRLSEKKVGNARDSAPNGGGSGMPCGACREFFYQLDEAKEN